MKKFLTMALALMMVLSLFAVPTMAATTTDYLINEDFDSLAVGALSTSKSATSFSVGNNSTGAIVSIASEGIAPNGDSVNVLKLNNTVVNKTPALYSNTFNIPANTAYFLTFDYYVVEPALTTQSASYAVRLGDNNTYKPQTAKGDGKAFYSEDGTTWKASGDTWKYYVPERNEDKTAYVTGQWATKTVYVKSDCARTNEYIVWQMWNGFTNQQAPGTICYFDNISLSATVEAAAVTKTVTGNGTLTGVADVVALGTSATLELTPNTTNSYLKSLSVDGVDVTANVTETFDLDANEFVYTYPVTINADTTIVAEFADYNVIDVLPLDDMESIDYELGSSSEGGFWYTSSTADITVATDSTHGNVIYVKLGDIRTPAAPYELGRYKVSFDAIGNANDTIRIQNSGATSSTNANWNGTPQGAVMVNISTEWDHYELYLDIKSFTTGDETFSRSIGFQLYGSSAVTEFKLDNVSVQNLSKTAAPVTPPAPTTAAVTINEDANAVTSVAANTVAIGEGTTFTVAPKFGYYIASITVGGEAFVGFDAYKGGTYETGAIAADTAIVVTVAALADSAIAGVSSDVATLPAVFASAEPVTFGKVLDANATLYGVELTKEGQPVTTNCGGGPLFAAESKNASGQFAVEFIGLEAGEYTVRTFAKVDGTITYGAPTTFVVD